MSRCSNARHKFKTETAYTLHMEVNGNKLQCWIPLVDIPETIISNQRFTMILPCQNKLNRFKCVIVV